MRTLIAVAALIATVALPVSAQQGPTYVGQVPMLTLPDGNHPDIDAFVGKHWKAYWRAAGELGFGPANIRVGRFDLDGDGAAELFVLIDSPEWISELGKPLVVASWTQKGWMPVGWSWSDEDGVFVVNERRDGWHSLDTGKQMLLWGRKGYDPVNKPQS